MNLVIIRRGLDIITGQQSLPICCLVLHYRRHAIMTKSIAMFLLVIGIMAVVAMPTEAQRRGRKNGCAMRAGNRRAHCRSNTSFIKRILEAQRQGDVAPDTPEERDWAELEAERRGKDADTVQEKLRLLNELLEELDLYDMK
ncbi:uncharacterized protein LOC110975462 isoform X1 [Acanthaster planci]|uniref:Uncharacterized protein LOC110975462 isoform X1 n=1 Tax=Acanthaster planci TaxID=133434 RepID=A0A8B7XS42_ACAPL|nr:uncharacterized protein LOC110975462 isoform X1 [Acanthaster planci]